MSSIADSIIASMHSIIDVASRTIARSHTAIDSTTTARSRINAASTVIVRSRIGADTIEGFPIVVFIVSADSIVDADSDTASSGTEAEASTVDAASVTRHVFLT